ncbi:hypothetical protein ACFT5D_07770 [Streptomyces sp. NPDC057144]|uniref:hypothetical protein n=1 Tax=Streptomyces sp. NPDC057144 TaxID=3346034 RepID=UPI003643AACC
MTNEELLEDLKQYISATVSQATAELATKADVTKRFDEMDERLDEIQNGIGEVLLEHDNKLREHDTQLRHLKHKLA